MYNNTMSSIPTRFLTGATLICEAGEKLKIGSENWAYPYLVFGDPDGRYYAEIWRNGMDWQHNYWVIEYENFEDPKAKILIIFADHKEEDKFNEYDFQELLKACLWYRRDKFWIKTGDSGIYNDGVWPFFKKHSSTKRHNIINVSFAHASQPEVWFDINVDFLPENLKQIYNKEQC